MGDATSDEQVEQQPFNAPAPLAMEAAFSALANLLEIVADPRESKRRLRGFHEALAAVDVAQKNLLAAQTEFSVHEEKTRAELAERETAVSAREVKAHLAEQELQGRETDLARQCGEVRRQDEALKRRAMQLAGIEAHALRDLPSWRQLVEELLESEPELELEAITSRPSDVPVSSTLAQTTFRQPRQRSMRRVEA